MFFVAGDYGQAMAAGNGGNEGIIVGQRLVPGLGHEASPFHRRRLVKSKNRVAEILEDKAKGAFEREPRLGLAFQLDAAPNFSERQGGDADFTRMRGKPSADGIPGTKVVADDVRVGQIFQNRPGGTFSFFAGSKEKPSAASASRWAERSDTDGLLRRARAATGAGSTHQPPVSFLTR